MQHKQQSQGLQIVHQTLLTLYIHWTCLERESENVLLIIARMVIFLHLCVILFTGWGRGGGVVGFPACVTGDMTRRSASKESQVLTIVHQILLRMSKRTLRVPTVRNLLECFLFYAVCLYKAKAQCKQECIPVGCRLSALYRTGGLYLGGLPDRDLPPLDRDPLDRDHPPPRTEWKTRVKVLPCPKLRLRAVISLEPYLHTWLSLRYLCAARGSVPHQSASRRAFPPLWAPHSVPCWRQRRKASGRRDVRVRRTCKHPLQSVLPSRVTPDINKTNRRS